MFSREDLECLDPGYFEIIYMDDRDVSIMSRNTRHMWYIHNPEYPLMGSCIIFHKHKVSHPYHQHGRSNTLRQAVRSIKRHDKWQMEKEEGITFEIQKIFNIIDEIVLNKEKDQFQKELPAGKKLYRARIIDAADDDNPNKGIGKSADDRFL